MNPNFIGVGKILHVIFTLMLIQVAHGQNTQLIKFEFKPEKTSTLLKVGRHTGVACKFVSKNNDIYKYTVSSNELIKNSNLPIADDSITIYLKHLNETDWVAATSENEIDDDDCILTIGKRCNKVISIPLKTGEAFKVPVSINIFSMSDEKDTLILVTSQLTISINTNLEKTRFLKEIFIHSEAPAFYHNDPFQGNRNRKFQIDEPFFWDGKYFVFKEIDLVKQVLVLEELMDKYKITGYNVGYSIDEKINQRFHELLPKKKATILFFWLPCQLEEIEDFEEIVNFADEVNLSKNFNFLSICIKCKPNPSIKNYKSEEVLDSLAINNLIFQYQIDQLFNPNCTDDESCSIVKALRVKTFPWFIIIDKSGKIIERKLYEISQVDIAMKKMKWID